MPSPNQVAAKATTLVRSLQDQHWDITRLPQAVRDVPTMISEYERALLYQLTRDHYRGAGSVVDAGCFLGGSTLALAQGLLDRQYPIRDRVIHTFDLFRLDEGSYRPYESILEGMRPGDSLRSRFNALIGDRQDLVAVAEGDIRKATWSAGPIEVLFIDLAKAWSINDHVSRMFFPSLIPGQSVVIQQDYCHEWTPWLLITMELLSDAFVYCESVPFASAIFVPRRPIALTEIPKSLFKDLSHDDKLNLYDRATERFAGEDRAVLECGRAYLLSMIGRRSAAETHLETIAASFGGPRIEQILPQMRQVVSARRGWIRRRLLGVAAACAP
jgi:hypothetical protein